MPGNLKKKQGQPESGLERFVRGHWIQPPGQQAEALLGTARELIIEHHGREYRLRVTQQGKLILTA